MLLKQEMRKKKNVSVSFYSFKHFSAKEILVVVLLPWRYLKAVHVKKSYSIIN